MRTLKKSEKDIIWKFLKNRFGIKTIEANKYIDNLLTNDKRIWVVSKTIMNSKIDFTVVNAGMYFGFMEKDCFKPSLEASMLLEKHATKNVVELSKEQLNSWLVGKDVEGRFDVEEGYVFIKHGNDILGCGKYKNNRIMNFVRKGRRVVV